MSRRSTASDPASAEILRNALSVAAEEASIVVVKSAYSSFIVEGSDASAAILDREGRLIAQSAATTLAHGASLRACVQAVVEDHPRETMRPGDVFAMNDVYRGGIHANDVAIFRPVFVGDDVAYFTATLIHVGDLGGLSAGGIASGATEVFLEGLQLPPVRIATADGPVEEIMRLLALNSRGPASVLGDVRALIAGANVAARRMEALIENLGPVVLADGINQYLDYAEARMRAGIAALPDGVYRGEYVIDDDGIHPNISYTVRVTVTVREDEVTIDFTDTDGQVRAAINCGTSQATSAAMFGLRCFLDGTIPMNEGCFRPVTFVLPRGSLVNPEPPHAAGGRSILMSAAIDSIFQALAAAQPEHLVAASGLLHSFAISPAEGGTRAWMHMAYEYGGLGGRQGSDGPDATGIHFGLARNTIAQLEPIEARCPFVVESKEFIPDSGGPGRWRGGLGVRTVLHLLEPAVITTRADRMRIGPPGREGGESGRPGRYLRVRPDGETIDLPSKTGNHRFEAGDRFVIETSGGGGLGEVAVRDREAVARDVTDGRVTRDAAIREYALEAKA